MLITFAHAGHSHESMESVKGLSAVDHCAPVIVAFSIVVIILLAVIAYLLVQRAKLVKRTAKKIAKK